MARMVIDANVVLARLLGESASQQVSAILDRSELVAPSLWRLEVLNTILVNERRRSITRAEADEMIELIDTMVIELVAEPAERSALDLADFSRPHQLTTYDAVYVELASRLALPLFSLDNNMITAARRLGVPVVSVT